MSRDGKIKRRNTEMYGLALIIVAVLALAGLILAPVLGNVGLAVKGFITGVFGLSAYALFTAVLAAGVALFRNYTVAVSAKRFVCVAGMFVLALLILHTVSSARFFRAENVNYSSYLLSCYNNNPVSTFGGLILGAVVYPIVKAVTIAGAYVVFGLMFLVFLLGFLDFRVFARRTRTPKVVKGADSKPSASVTKPTSNKTLSMPFFTIQNNNGVSVSEGVASSMPGKRTESGSRQIETLRATYYNDSSEGKYKPAQAAGAEIAYPSQGGYGAAKGAESGAKYNSFVADTATYNRNAQQPSSAGSVSGFDVSAQNNYSSASGQSQYARPPKIVHEESSRSNVNKPFVAPKIINAEERSREIASRKSQSAENVEAAASANQTETAAKVPPPRPYVMPKIIDADAVSNELREGKLNPDKADNLSKFKQMLKGSYNNSSSYNMYEDASEQDIEDYEADNSPVTAAPVAPSQYSVCHTDNARASEVREPAHEDVLPPKVTAVPVKAEPEESAPDYTGYYKVVKPEPPASTLEQKIGALEGVKLPRKTKVSENQIPIEDYIQQTAKPARPARRRSTARYVVPPVDLLQNDSTYTGSIDERAHDKAAQLEQVLEEFKTPAKVIGITKGPAVTRYELQMPPGVSVRKISDKAEDIAYTMAASAGIRIETPIPGKQAVGIEIPNEIIDKVSLREIIESREFAQAESPLSFALGKDVAGKTMVCDLLKMPHLLVAGATNSGKSSCLNSLITSMLYRSSPEDLRMILIDPKRVEFTSYKGLPHLLLENPITEPEVALKAFEWAFEESESRFQLFAAARVRDIKEYNASKTVVSGGSDKLPYIVIVVDELADLMLQYKRDFEDRIRAIAQKSRAAGLHLVIATQRPSVDIITGTIKANLPSRIAFSVTSFADSKTILDQGGAEKLLGRGDMLYAPVDRNEPVRVQGAYVTNDDVLDVVNFVKDNNESYFDKEIEERIYKAEEEPDEDMLGMSSANGDDSDPSLPQILKMFMDYGQASATLIQRRFRYGYAKAARIMDQLELKKFITPFDGTNKPRKILITKEQYEELYGDIDE